MLVVIGVAVVLTSAKGRTGIKMSPDDDILDEILGTVN